MNKRFFWVCSYPKSGNTWMRAILTSLFFTNDGNFDFKLLPLIPTFEKAKIFDFVKNINKEDYNHLDNLNILSKYWIESQKRMKINGDFSFFKSHSSLANINNNLFTNTNNTLGLIYLIRNPLDVVVSYSKHLGKNTDEIIKIITSNNSVTFTNDNHIKKLPFLLSRWDNHINSWLKIDSPKLILKYEDLIENTTNSINKIVNFFEKNYNFKFQHRDLKINNIVKSTKLNIMQKHENLYGFKEAKKSKFFRSGKINNWNKYLTKKQAIFINREFNQTMKKFGY